MPSSGIYKAKHILCDALFTAQRKPFFIYPRWRNAGLNLGSRLKI